MGTLTVPTTGTVSGLQNNQDINTALAALATANQGGSAPTTGTTGLASTSGVLWHDTTNNLLKLRDQADTTWMTLGAFDETKKLFTPYYQGIALPALLRGHIGGLGLSNDGTSPSTTLDVAPGIACSDNQAAMLQLGSTWTKTLVN